MEVKIVVLGWKIAVSAISSQQPPHLLSLHLQITKDIGIQNYLYPEKILLE